LDDAAQGGRSLTACPGLLLRDWGESTCVAFEPATARTHWISAEAAAVLTAIAADEPPDPTVAAETIDALLGAGLLRCAE
jgi:hypothetical protein